MKVLVVISVLAVCGALLAQVVLTPVNQGALLFSGNTNVFSLSNATQIVSGLKLGMTQTNVDRYLNAHGMTNGDGGSADEGENWNFYYVFPGTDRTLVLEMHSSKPGPHFKDWGRERVLTGGRIQRVGVDTFLIAFTNAP